MKDLTADFVRECFAEEARRALVSVDDVIGAKRTANAVSARRRAIRRIAIETGAAAYKIAKVWGADHTTVADCLTEDPGIAPYTQATLARLTWQYGPDRARAIVDEQDAATNDDLGRWRNLGRRSAA